VRPASFSAVGRGKARAGTFIFNQEGKWEEVIRATDSIDCTGNQEVMAKQVRPWLAKLWKSAAQKVR
jgi:hypothetical protein